MNTERLEVAHRSIVADLVAKDSDGRIVLLVEFRGGAAEQQAISDITSYLKAVKMVIPFAMLVDLEDIQIFQWDGANLSEPISSLKTAAVLSHYDPEFGSKRIFEPYLITLVDVWLHDLEFHWKSKTPPASEQLAAIGLLQRLEGGTTQTEVELGSHTLR